MTLKRATHISSSEQKRCSDEQTDVKIRDETLRMIPNKTISSANLDDKCTIFEITLENVNDSLNNSKYSNENFEN